MGMNSGLDPFLVPRNQLAFAVNATVRGNFVTNRPPYYKQTLNFDAGVQAAFEGGLFQGACYFAPFGGQQQIVTQIGGRLFAITPNQPGPDAEVIEVTIPGDPNDASLTQAWMTQGERWVVVNNGLALPVFYDGISSRRSYGASTSQATTAAATFITPVIGGTVVVGLTAAYTGPTNQTVQLVEYDLNGNVTTTTNYVVTNGGNSFTYVISLKNLGDVPGAAQGLNSDLVIQSSCIGNILTISSSVSGGNTNVTMGMSSAANSWVPVGASLTINGDSGWIITDFQNGRTTIKAKHVSPAVVPAVGDQVFVTANTSPNVVAGTLKLGFVAPAVGAVVAGVTIYNQMTYGVGQVLFVNGKQYSIDSISAPAPVGGAATVTLLNLNDSRVGHLFNDAGALATQIFNIPELPAGRNLAYGLGQMWEALTDAQSFIYSDHVGDPSGSPGYNYRDAVLKASEVTLLTGNLWNMPSNLGLITAMAFTSQLDASLGQGPLMIVTPGGIFSANAPTDPTNQVNPILSESLIGLGGLCQNSTIVVNGDLIFRSVDGIRSLIMARRDFWSWGNAPISFEMERVITKDNPEGLPWGSAAQFDNRMLMTCSPAQSTQGVYNQGLIALNMDPVSSLQGKGASVYDGLWTGINVLQIIEGQFGASHRCFALTYSTAEKKIQLYELLRDGELDNGVSPITWSFETPMMFKDPAVKQFFDLIALEDCEFYVSDIKPGQKLRFKVEYRPDFSNCWYPWHEFDYCNDSTSTVPIYGDRLGLGRPPTLNSNKVNYQSANFGRWFQLRFTITGHCVFKGLKITASKQPQTQYARVIPAPAAATFVSVSARKSNGVIYSGELCSSGTLSISIPIPAWIKIEGFTLVGMAGVFWGDTQAQADSAATEAMNDFIALAQSIDAVSCGGVLNMFENTTWTVPDNTQSSLVDSTLTRTPQNSSGNVELAAVDYAVGASGLASVDSSDPNDGYLIYNGPAINCNLHIEIVNTAAPLFISAGYAIFVVTAGPTYTPIITGDVSAFATGGYDIPFVIPDTAGLDVQLNPYAFVSLTSGGINPTAGLGFSIEATWTTV